MSASDSDSDVPDYFGSPSGSSEQRKKAVKIIEEINQQTSVYNTITVLAVKPKIPADANKKPIIGFAIQIAGSASVKLGNLCFKKEKNSTHPSFTNTGITQWVHYAPDPNDRKNVLKTTIVKNEKPMSVKTKRFVRVLNHDSTVDMTEGFIKGFVENAMIPMYNKKVLDDSEHDTKGETIKLATNWYQEVDSWSEILIEGDLPKMYGNSWLKNINFVGPKKFEDFVKEDKAYLYSIWSPGHIPPYKMKNYKLAEKHLAPQDFHCLGAGKTGIKALFDVQSPVDKTGKGSRTKPKSDSKMPAKSKESEQNKSSSKSSATTKKSDTPSSSKKDTPKKKNSKKRAAGESDLGIDEKGFSTGGPSPLGKKVKAAEIEDDPIQSSTSTESDVNVAEVPLTQHEASDSDSDSR
ncbi:hypothetical protein SEMRO_2203_G318950.1 [Seminavis robusta]|uniref:Uncharacterized protein n=1 Tax=Seminavis robusta TaxID=568900 RepID=A0A9N8EWD4_9STRA|nr:hypothetical protein SEMRO_2203_G318950.1 [Seminavis robusta]|eukprot:Sro2203_g318950.1 n/a (407) ;mRNA; r:8020-9240